MLLLRPWLAVVVLGPAICLGLYEDQVFKFDWRQQYVGTVCFNFGVIYHRTVNGKVALNDFENSRQIF